MSQNRGEQTKSNGFTLYSTKPKSAKELAEIETENNKRAEEVAAALQAITSLKDGWFKIEKKVLVKPVLPFPELDINQADLFLQQFATETKACIAKALTYNKSALEKLYQQIEENPGDLHAYACYALLTDNIAVLDKEKLAKVHALLSQTNNEQILRSIEFIQLMLSQKHQAILNDLLKEKKFSKCYLNMSGILFHKTNLHESDETKVVDLSYANLANTYFSSKNACDTSSFDHVNLHGARLIGANLNGVKFNACSLEAADLRGCSFEKASFIDTTFKRANLTSVDLRTAHFNNVSLARAILIEADVIPFEQKYRVHLGQAVLIDINKKMTVADMLEIIILWRKLHVPGYVIYGNLLKLLDNKALKYQPEDKKTVLLEVQKLFAPITEADVNSHDMKFFHAENCYLAIQKQLTKIEFKIANKCNRK